MINPLFVAGNDDPLQGEIAWNRTPRELGISAYALQQLGGSHAATPKQIRELMKVDGLTNDEVKSHLQVCISILHAISGESFYTYM
ncbi:hypothetical protein ACFXTN_014454 [Malus domestica]